MFNLTFIMFHLGRTEPVGKSCKSMDCLRSNCILENPYSINIVIKAQTRIITCFVVLIAKTRLLFKRDDKPSQLI